jgi:hypothetical protein
MESAGLINPNIQPQGMVQKGIDFATQGAVGGALTGGASLPRAIAGAALGAGSGVAAGATQEATGNPALAATAGMLPMVPGMRPSGVTPPLKSQNQVKNETFVAGQQLGLKAPPSSMKPTFVGNRIEGIGGKAALGQETALENQQVVNKVAKAEAGLAPDQDITVKTLKAVRSEISAPYEEIRALPGIPAKQVGVWHGGMGPPSPMMSKTPANPKQLIEDWQSNNSKISDLWNDYKRNGRVETLNEYRGARATQETIEKNIEAAAIAANRADLVPALREARVKLAKNFDVERALNLGDGNVDPAVLGRMYDHGSPLTGGLETIAKFQQAFPNAMRESAKVPTPGVSKIEALASLSLGMAGHGSGLGWFPMGLPLISGPARSLALSTVMQGNRQYGPGLLSQTAQRTSPIVTQGILADILNKRQ